MSETNTPETTPNGASAANGLTPPAPTAPPPVKAVVSEPPPPPIQATVAVLRLRMKVWTDSKTGKRYLMPTAVVTDPVHGTMTAYAMSDEDTKTVKLTPPEWNALPFFYFKEDGPAPRASARPVDVLTR